MSDNKYIDEEDFIKSYLPAFNESYGVTEDELRQYYRESIYIGHPIDPSGSIWVSEGKAIYCLVRILKPKKILEIGNFKGRSTNHILQAVEMNGTGEVHLVDIKEQLEFDKLHNREFVRHIDDSLNFLKSSLDYDLYIQDGNHEFQHVKKELELISDNTTIDFDIWSHDYWQIYPPQCEVKRAWDAVENKFYDVYPMKDSVSDCGFVIAKYKKQ